MLPRQDIVEIFSTFIQFDYDRFNRWATDGRLRRSMNQCLTQISQENSDKFWGLYWHKIWQEKPKSIAKEHLTAYLQEVCYWSAQKTITGFDNNQYTIPDCFQVAIAGIEKVLKGFDRERGFNLKSYASITFSNLIRELLRQKGEIDICSDWSLLRKISQKRLTEALANLGLNEDVIERQILAWNCLKTVYVPDRPSSTRKLTKPDRDTWIAIADLYNQERHTQLTNSSKSVTPETIEQSLLVSVKAARSYLFPNMTSLNQPQPGRESGEITDTLVGEVDESLIADLIVAEEIQERTQKQTDINQFLSSTVKALTPEEQQVLKLYYGLELKQSQIAKELNTEQYNVSRKLKRVRTALLKSLAQWSKNTMHISLTSDVLNGMSSILEEWLAGYYNGNQLN
ncbi:MAG: sigma-70 family RNA polymerase sigma factor [Pleurocapsa sp.]